jgi:hypothetical protein
MKTWDKFFRDVMPDVPGCPDPIAEHAILRAAQEFFELTGVWRIWMDDTSTSLNNSEYDIGLPTNTELVRIERATLGGREIEITTADCLPIDWKTNSASLADCIHTVDRKTVMLLPAPKTIATMRIEVTLKPGSAALGIEDFLFDQYAEMIAIGAKARLMKQPGKPYTNANDSMILTAEFKQAMANVSIVVSRGFSSHRTRSAGRFF